MPSPATPTVKDTKSDPSASITTQVGNSFTPAANSLIIAEIFLSKAGTPAPGSFTISSTHTGIGAWATPIFRQRSSGSQTVAMSWCIAGASPSAGQITWNWSNASIRTTQKALECASGFNTTTPVPQSGGADNAASTLAITFGSTPASDSLIIGGVLNVNGSGVTPGSGFTELAEETTGSGPNLRTQTQYINGSATTTCDWSGLGTSSNVGLAIEIAAASSGITSTGGVTIQKPTLSGSGTFTGVGGGAVTIQKPTLNGSGTFSITPITATGGVTIQKPTLSGTESTSRTGTGTITIQKPTLNGAGTAVPPPITGTGGVQIGHPSFAGFAPGLSGSGGSSSALILDLLTRRR